MSCSTLFMNTHTDNSTLVHACSCLILYRCEETCNTEPNCPFDICACSDSFFVQLPAVTMTPPTTTAAPPTTTAIVSAASAVCQPIDGNEEDVFWKQWCQKKCDRGLCAVEYCTCA